MFGIFSEIDPHLPIVIKIDKNNIHVLWWPINFHYFSPWLFLITETGSVPWEVCTDTQETGFANEIVLSRGAPKGRGGARAAELHPLPYW